MLKHLLTDLTRSTKSSSENSIRRLRKRSRGHKSST
jgi:hypothetical protein